MYAYIYIYMYICTYVYMYICIYVCMYVCMYVIIEYYREICFVLRTVVDRDLFHKWPPAMGILLSLGAQGATSWREMAHQYCLGGLEGVKKCADARDFCGVS